MICRCAYMKVNHGDTIVFEGDCLLTPEGAFHEELYPSNNDGGMRAVPVYIKGRKNVTIDGRGSTLLFDGKLSPIAIEDCEDVVLKNMTIDFLRPLLFQGTVLASNQEYLDLKIDDSAYEIAGRNLVWHVNGGDLDAEQIYLFDYDNDCITGRKYYILPHLVVGSHTDKYTDSVWSRTTYGAEYPRYLLCEVQQLSPGKLRFIFLERSMRLVYPVGERCVL